MATCIMASKSWFTCIFIAVSTSLVAVHAKQEGLPSCSFEIEGKSYDFSRLGGTTLKAKSDTYEYAVNVCGGVADGCDGPICQFDKAGRVEAILAANQKEGEGEWSFLEGDSSKGVKIQSKNGDVCYRDTAKRVATIEFTCDSSAGLGAETFKVKDDVSPSCHGNGYVFQMRTACSCSGGCSGGWGTLHLLIVLTPIAFLLYAAGGCYYNHKYKETKLGKESMPNKEFWEAAPGRVKTGFKFVKEKVAECRALPFPYLRRAEQVDEAEIDEESQSLLDDGS